MTNSASMKKLMILKMAFSILYIILMFWVLTKGSRWEFYGQLIRISYGLALFILGLRLLFFVVSKEELKELFGGINYTSSRQTILDENLENKVINDSKRVGLKIDFVISCIHLAIALFLILGEFIFGISYPTIMVLGFVYATFLSILGLAQFP